MAMLQFISSGLPKVNAYFITTSPCIKVCWYHVHMLNNDSHLSIVGYTYSKLGGCTVDYTL